MGPAIEAESVLVERTQGASVRLLLVAADGTRMFADFDALRAIQISGELLGGWSADDEASS